MVRSEEERLAELALEASEGRIFGLTAELHLDDHSDMGRVLLRGYVWGEGLAQMSVGTPATPWDAVKDHLRRKTPLTFLEPQMKDLRLTILAVYPGLSWYPGLGDTMTIGHLDLSEEQQGQFGSDDPVTSPLGVGNYQEVVLHKVPLTLPLVIPADLELILQPGSYQDAFKSVLSQLIQDGFLSPSEYVVKEPKTTWDAVKAWLNRLRFKICRRLPFCPLPVWSCQFTEDVYSVEGLEQGAFIKSPSLVGSYDAYLVLVREV